MTFQPHQREDLALKTAERRAGRDVARFDSTDAWLIFALWAAAEGHPGLCVTALVIVVVYLWAIVDAEKEAAAAVRQQAIPLEK